MVAINGCLSPGHHWRPGQQLKHVPWLGIEPATLWFSAHAQSTELHQPGLLVIYYIFISCILTTYEIGTVIWFYIWRAKGLEKMITLLKVIHLLGDRMELELRTVWILKSYARWLNYSTHSTLLLFCILFWKKNLQVHVKGKLHELKPPHSLLNKIEGNSKLSVFWLQTTFLALFPTQHIYRFNILTTSLTLLWCGCCDHISLPLLITFPPFFTHWKYDQPKWLFFGINIKKNSLVAINHLSSIFLQQIMYIFV